MQTNQAQWVHRSEESGATTVRPVAPVGAQGRPPMTRDEQFMAMLNGYRLSGGLARCPEVASLLASHAGLNIGTLARWIVEGHVVHFDWQDETWFPMFQFSGLDLAPRAAVARVLLELRGVFDPWETAQWFATPSATLGDRSPADALDSDPDRVLHAARCDRYVADA